MLFQFNLDVRVACLSSSTFKLLDAVLGGEGGGDQLGEDQVDLGHHETAGAKGSQSAQSGCHTGLLLSV